MSVVSESTVQPLYKPDPAAMQAHVEHLFGGWLPGCQDGLVELAWTDTTPDANGKYAPVHGMHYGTDKLDELVEEAARLNATPFCNVYIGAALRHPDTPVVGRTKDKHAWALPAAYTDLDEPDAFDNAKNVYGDNKPTLVVLTGLHPHGRAQLWWRLDEPVFDSALWSAQLHGIATAMNGDHSVANPGRIMRLAGSIAWPTKPERVVEVTRISPLKRPGPSAYIPEHLALVFPPGAVVASEEDVSVPGAGQPETPTTGTLGLLPAKLDDGREAYMLRTVLACMVEFIGTHGATPTPQELFDAAWPQYERKVDLKSRAGRGPDEMAEKCRYTLKRFERGDIKGLRSLDEVVAAYRKKREAWLAAPASAREARTPKADTLASPAVNDDVGPFQATDLTGEPPERRWLVKDWIPEGAVTSLYGDGGVGKTLIAQQLAYSAGIGRPWLGMTVPKVRTLCVMCEDERDEIHRRHHAIKASLGYSIGNPFEDVWLWPRVGFDNLLVTFDRDGTPKVSPLFERVRSFVIEQKIGFLILDTAADLYGGNEIVRSEVNYFLKAVCGRLVREAGEAGHVLTVLILAHPSQAGKESGQGFSGNTAWNNGVRARLYLNAVEDGHPDERILTRKKSNYSRSGDGEQINLIWDKGVLVPMEMSDRGLMIKAKERILALVKSAWDSGEPYLKRKGSPRNLELKMVEYLRAEGFSLGSIVEALREVKEASQIVVKSVNSRHGWAISGS